MKTSWPQKFLLILGGTLAGLILVELSLRAFSSMSIFLQSNENTVSHADENSIRILAVGESTTSENWRGRPEHAWPGQLEAALNKIGKKKYRVYNEGRATISSTWIVEHFPFWLEKYRPNYVISMMGINDIYATMYLREHDHWWSQLRIVKVMKWLNQAKKPGPDILAKLKPEIPFPQREEDIPGFMKNVEMKAKENQPYEWFFYRYYGIQIFRSNDTKLHSLGREWILRSVIQAPEDELSFIILHEYLKKIKNKDELHSFLQDALSRGLDKEMLSLLPDTEKNQNGIHSRKVATAYSILANNYRTLARTAMTNNVKLAIMSYPTTSIDSLKHIFASESVENFPHLIAASQVPFAGVIAPEFNSVLWVSNENFIEKMNEKERAYYFDDMFSRGQGGTVGHTTPAGHALIVENILEALKNEL